MSKAIPIPKPVQDILARAVAERDKQQAIIDIVSQVMQHTLPVPDGYVLYSLADGYVPVEKEPIDTE